MQPMAFAIDVLTEAWLADCAAIAATAPDTWSLADLQRVLGDVHHRTFVARAGEQVVGFASFLALADTADLELVAVHPAWRRQGVARQLLAFALPQLQAAGAKQVLLEVRASNTAALALYRRLGFAQLARRPAMYARPREDGILMAIHWAGNNKE